MAKRSRLHLGRFRRSIWLIFTAPLKTGQKRTTKERDNGKRVRTMNIKKIEKLQKRFGYDKWQGLIESGRVWSLEGTAGRTASNLLENGVCFLPETSHKDFWGNTVPGRKVLKEGTKGTIGNAENFWEKVESGEITIEKDEYFSWM